MLIARSDWKPLLEEIRNGLRDVSTVPANQPHDAVRQSANRAEFDKLLQWARDLRFNEDATDDEVWQSINVHPYFAFVSPPKGDSMDKARQYLSDYRELAQPGWIKSAQAQKYLSDPTAYSNTKKSKLPAIIAAATNLFNRQRLNNQRPLVDILVPKLHRSFSPDDLRAIHRKLKAELGYGPVTRFHLMMDLGLPVVKPDKMLIRTIVRLGLMTHSGDKLNRKPIPLRIDSEIASALGQDDAFTWELQDLLNDMSRETEIPMREIDLLFCKMGMEPSEEDGRPFTICDAKPNCKVCTAHRFCTYGQKHQPMKKAA